MSPRFPHLKYLAAIVHVSISGGRCKTLSIAGSKVFSLKSTCLLCEIDLQLQKCTLQRQVYFRNVHFAAIGVLLQRALCSDRCTEPCKFPSLDSYQMFLWTHKEVDLAPHPVVGLLLQVGVAEKFPHVVGFESLDSFFRVSKQDSCFTAVEEEGGRRQLQNRICCDKIPRFRS